MLELGVDFLDKHSNMDYCGVQTNDSVFSVDIDILNLSMSPKSEFVPSESPINNGTAARLIPFTIARKKIHFTQRENSVASEGKYFITSILFIILLIEMCWDLLQIY